MSASKPLFFVTSNANKLAEVKAILSTTGIKLESKSLDITEIQGTMEEISKDKARRAAEKVRSGSAIRNELYANLCVQVDGPVLVEDTSLCFNALKGLPGAYVYVFPAPYLRSGSKLTGFGSNSKHFLKDLGNDGLVKMLAAYDDKRAQAVCTIAYCEGPGKEPILFEGITDGKIVRQRGESTFGWDPIFEIKGST